MKMTSLKYIVLLLGLAIVTGGCGNRESKSYDDDDDTEMTSKKKKKKKKHHDRDNEERDEEEEIDEGDEYPEDPPITFGRDPQNPDYTPMTNAITAGEDGGKWDDLESGERVYTYPASDTYARSVWVKDGDKVYYVDASGCVMKDNWAHDGFYAGDDGAWDKEGSIFCANIEPKTGRKYTHESDTYWVFDRVDGKLTGKIVYSFGYEETYTMTPFGHSAYRLDKVDDDFVKQHLVVIPADGTTICVSGGGQTVRYEIEQ